VLLRDGGTLPLPGLDTHALFDGGSWVLRWARAALRGGCIYRTFLWRLWECDSAAAYVRVTVLASGDDVPAGLLGTVLLSPVDGCRCRGLTSRELEVLGLLVDGCSNLEMARTLAVTPRTVAAHMEHILLKLDAPTRTLAAVRADREGLYVRTVPSGPPPVRDASP
jgi:DNA-binding CsgD family transcriptional regulator